MSTIDDILPELSQAKVFSVFDVKNWFWHVELDKESSKLTCFNTPFGRYRWLRMPFGLAPAPEEFQRRQHQVLEGLPGVLTIHNDILLYGEGDTYEPLRRLTMKDVEWHWTEHQEQAFNKLKQLVTEAPVLKYFEPKEELILQSDASDTGLGAVLTQNGQPIAFASRALSDAETRYAHN